MRKFLQGRIDLVHALRASNLPVAPQDLELILTSVISACASWRWPGEGFDRKRFVQSLIEFCPQSLHMDFVSTGALLELGKIEECDTDWGEPGEETRIFCGEEIDCSLSHMSNRYSHVPLVDLKKATYANLIYRWLRCGYAHRYLSTGNTTHVPPSRLPAQISYIGRIMPDGRIIRISCFHFDYLMEVAQAQVSSLADRPLEKPQRWWLDQE